MIFMQYRHYSTLLVLFVVVLLISNISATKLISFGPLILDGGAVLFPIAYVLGDIITEVYGFRYMRRAIWTGFACLLLMSLTFLTVQWLPPAADYQNQAAFEAVLGFLPRIAAASLAAYLVGGFINATILVKIKQWTNEKHLWLRLIGSTLIGQLFDTITFCLIAFGGVIGAADMMTYITVGWIFKTLVEVLLLPAIYRLVAWLKRAEGADSDDSNAALNWIGWSLTEHNSDLRNRS